MKGFPRHMSEMTYKRYFSSVLVLFMSVQILRFILAYLINPVGIWDAPVVHGFNHYKTKQEYYLDVCKPYEYIREQPDILYIGASQMIYGFEPVNKDGRKIYTMGLSALSLPDMREYLRFVYKIHKPKVIYMGIAPESFERKNYYRKREGYSLERLQHLINPFGYGRQILQDSLDIHDVYWATIKASWEHKGERVLYQHGWEERRAKGTMIPKVYYARLNDDIKIYKTWNYIPEAMDCFREIVNEAKGAEVPLIVFFTPMSVDRYASIRLMEHGSDYRQIKRMVAEFIPIYDFATVNELSTNRDMFFDSWHFKSSLGEKLKPILAGKSSPEPYGYLLTPETCDAAFAAEDAAWEKWKSENAEYVQALTECIESGRKPEVGDFAKYIGF